MDLKVGTKLVCIVNNSKMFAPCEVVEVEKLAESGGSGYYKIKGYIAWLSKDTIEKLFRIYEVALQKEVVMKLSEVVKEMQEFIDEEGDKEVDSVEIKRDGLNISVERINKIHICYDGNFADFWLMG